MSLPEKIGRYEIVNELGQGGMAVVYLARDPFMDRQVAVKLLPRQMALSESLQVRFQQEAKIVASLEHPAIVPVHDFGEFNEQPFLVMRYMVGGSLRDYRGGEAMALTDVVRILSPLAQALDKAHAQHIIHRDLKPDNILFDGDKNPYLSDFGIARLAEGTQTTSIMGTPAYMSPEQIKGDVQLDGRSDIYALGVILFEMLSGQQPYTADTPTQVMMKHVLEPVPVILDLASDLPPMTQLVIEQAMAKERDDRYATAEALVQAVEALLTASQAAEVGAALAAAAIPQTIVELPEPAPGYLETVIEPPQIAPGSGAGDRGGETAAAQETAARPAEKAPASRRRQIYLVGCAVLVMIVLCLVLLFALGTYFNNQASGVIPTETAGVLTNSEEIPAVDVTAAVASPTPQPTSTTEATQTAEPTSAPPEATAEPLDSPAAFELFADTFDGKSSAEDWALWQDESAEFRIVDGQLTAAGLDEEMINWVHLVEPYDTFEASVEAGIVEGGGAAFFGFVFEGAEGNYVGCFVQGDNSAYCAQSVDGETEYGDWVAVDLSVLRDNEILFVVHEQQWAMTVNNQCVGSGSVGFEPGGQIGLAVTTETSAEPAVVTYDNFVLLSPADQGLAILNCEPEFYDSGE